MKPDNDVRERKMRCAMCKDIVSAELVHQCRKPMPPRKVEDPTMFSDIVRILFSKEYTKERDAYLRGSK